MSELSGITLYVSESGEDSGATGWGTRREAAFRSIAFAVIKAARNDTIVILPGCYRGMTVIPQSLTGLSLVGEGDVLLKGSAVISPAELETERQNGITLYCMREWQANTQQVYINGKSISQIGGILYGDAPNPTDQQAVWPGRRPGDKASLFALPAGENAFYYDQAGKTLYLRYDALQPEDLIEAAKDPAVIRNWADKVTLSGLTVMHANTSGYNRHGAVNILNADDCLIENLTVAYNDSIGLHVNGNNNRIEDCEFGYNGQLGLAVKGDGNHIKRISSHHNNTRNFGMDWEAGGVKCMGTVPFTNGSIEDSVFFNNMGDGIWFDTYNDNVTITNVVCAHNEGHGLHYELSYRAAIRDSKFFKNKKRGIYLSSSAECTVENNEIYFNDYEGLAVINDLNRKENVKIPFGESHHKFIDNLCGWNCRSYGNIIREIAFTSKKPDASGIIEAYDELSESDGNIYFKESGVRLQLTARKKTVNHDKWTEMTNQDAHSLYFSAPVTEELEKECNREVSLDLLDSFNARSIIAETVRHNEPEKFSADSGNTLSLLFPDGRLQAHG